MVFFFFQAEDGIRDYKVTGVQTCALPIWRLRLKQENRDKVLVFVADTYGIFHLAVLAGMRLTVVPHHPGLLRPSCKAMILAHESYTRTPVLPQGCCILGKNPGRTGIKRNLSQI